MQRLVARIFAEQSQYSLRALLPDVHLHVGFTLYPQRTLLVFDELRWPDGAINRVVTIELPLEAHRDGVFKGYLLDIGLLTAKLQLPMSSFLETTRLFDRFHGTLAEQIVQQELAATQGEKPHYWSAPRGNAEADFLLQSSGTVVPVDVTGVANPRAKKLAFYCEKFHPPVAVRISLGKYQCRRLPMPGRPDTEYTLIDLPLYAVSQLAPEIQSALDNA